MEHKEIAMWLAKGYGRKVSIDCEIKSSVYPLPAGIVEDTRNGVGVYWQVCASVDGLGIAGEARTIDESFALSLAWLVQAVAP